MQQRTFRAMGTEIDLFVDAPNGDAALTAAEGEFHRLESLFSRFRDDSELSRLNRDGAIDASPDLAEVVALALRAREQTGGRFDPTIHEAIVAAGYDRSFELLSPDGNEGRKARCGGGVRVDGDRIELEPGVKLDLGGIGKGYAAEQAATVLAAAGPCLVNAGGDVAIRAGAWPVGVQTSTGTLTLELSTGALATSGRDRRRWLRDGRELHHLIDPATGTSAEGDLLRVTVVGKDAVDAEVWAKALFLVGADAAEAEANALGLPCILVSTDGRTTTAGGLL
ncbi:MAG: FAD:protein FMN transferase [Gaiellaceae bacterium]